MKKNNKGFTVVEMIVSFSVTMVIMVFMFELVLLVKDLYISYGLKTELLTKQAIISEKINSDLLEKTVLITSQCGDDCIDFYFSDNSKARLVVSRDKGLIQYGDYVTKLLSGSSFGNIKVSTQTMYDVSSGKNDSILAINIPIYHKLLPEQNYGVNIAYQYKSYETAISDAYIKDTVDTASSIHLIGSSEMITFTGVTWTDPGYYVAYEDGTTQMSAPNVTITGTVGSTVGQTYMVTYTLKDSNSVTIDTVTRKVKVISNYATYDYTGGSQTFTAPVSGIYKLEVWGAQGGSSNSNDIGGKGGYSTGNVDLSKDDTLVINIGGQGNTPETGNGGYNGGGNGGQGSTLGAGGGGATDIRFRGTSLSHRIIVAGGGGGSGSYNNSTYKSTGGAGGGKYGANGSSYATSYNGSGASDTAGGAIATYNTSVTVAPTIGTLGVGGNGGVANDFGGGGGGGGYYGGGGAVRYGSGGGGSGYCGTLANCSTLVGTSQFLNTSGTSMETGHAGNGYAKITLLSIINTSN